MKLSPFPVGPSACRSSRCAMPHRPLCPILLFFTCLSMSAVAFADDQSKTTQTKFEFDYGMRWEQLPEGKTARFWTPLITSTPDQQVRRVATQLPDGAKNVKETTDARFGNPLLYFELTPKSQPVVLKIKYHVVRTSSRTREITSEESAMVQSHFLAPSSLVPLDPQLQKTIAPALSEKTDPYDLARQLYLAVNQHLTYGKPKGQPWGRGDARWVCDSKTGNCTDYHSLFIATCRSANIPAAFEIGFPIGKQDSGSVAGYHCWARFLHKDRWTPVDISEGDKNPELRDYFFGNLTADRVTVTVGRDLELRPKAAAGKVNYLVYPHVEVNGEVVSDVTLDVQYQRAND